jgi:hypothetical protein
VIKAVDSIRLRLLMLVVALGLVVPTVPAADRDCGAAPGRAVECCDDSTPANSCCPGEDDQDERENEDRGCCPGDCACFCCGCATANPLLHRSVPSTVSPAPPSALQLAWRSELAPQDSADELIRPPQA